MNVKDHLEHYGVKGMKWGVRKGRVSGGKEKLESKARKLSDSELKAAVERLRLEREYVQINKTLNPNHPASAIIQKYGGQAVSIVVGSATSAVVGKALGKAFKNK
jgi:hypothetical protein